MASRPMRRATCIKEALGHRTTALEQDQKKLSTTKDQYEFAVRSLNVFPNTPEGYAAWRQVQSTLLPDDVVQRLPTEWNAGLVATLHTNGLSLLQRLDKQIAGQLAVASSTPRRRRVLKPAKAAATCPPRDPKALASYPSTGSQAAAPRSTPDPRHGPGAPRGGRGGARQRTARAGGRCDDEA